MSSSPDAATRREAGGRRGIPWRAVGFALIAVYATIGLGLMIAALPGQALSPPQPDPAAAPPQRPAYEGDLFGSGSRGAPESSEDRYPPDRWADDADDDRLGPQDRDALADLLPWQNDGMERSRPLAVRIPRIGVNADIMAVGVDETGAIEVPPLEQAYLAGWYELGPSPGEAGNAVVVGHVDSYALGGPAVFFNLGALQPGDRIEIAREDGSVAPFVVDGVASFPKDTFPSDLVYGPANRPGLRLITCGGSFDTTTGDYRDNVIVFATLDESSQPQ